MIDLFITHRWHQDDARDRIIAELDRLHGFNWRNFSNIWYDPAVKISSPEGRVFIEARLTEQVTPSHAVLFVPEVYTGSNAGRLWAGKAVEMARRHSIPVLGILPAGQSVPPVDIAAQADRWIALEDLDTVLTQEKQASPA